jgi:hypothetical protein
MVWLQIMDLHVALVLVVLMLRLVRLRILLLPMVSLLMVSLRSLLELLVVLPHRLVTSLPVLLLLRILRLLWELMSLLLLLLEERVVKEGGRVVYPLRSKLCLHILSCRHRVLGSSASWSTLSVEVTVISARRLN